MVTPGLQESCESAVKLVEWEWEWLYKGYRIECFQSSPVVVGKDYVISNVYIVYLSYDSLVILLYCTIVTLIIRKNERISRQCSPCVYTSLPIALGKHPSGCGVNPPFAVCLTCVNHPTMKLDGCGFEPHFLYVSLFQILLYLLKLYWGGV